MTPSFREAEERRLVRLSRSQSAQRYRERTRILGFVFLVATVVLTIVMLVVQ